MQFSQNRRPYEVDAYLANKIIAAPTSIKIAPNIIGALNAGNGGGVVASEIIPIIGANKPNPSAPHANCLPTSPLPVDVSRVAMITAASSNAIAAVGNISAIDLNIKYNQNVTSGFPIVWTQRLSAKTLFGASYGSSTSQATTGIQVLFVTEFFKYFSISG